jgi:hypothetical protein
MNIAQIIIGITSDHCSICKYGRALIALRDLRDEDNEVLSKPDGITKPATAAPKSKLQKKTAKPKYLLTGKTCNGCGKSLPFSDFPKNKTCAGGYAGTYKKCAYERQKRNAASKKVQPAHVQHDDGSEATHQCKLCKAVASTPERLASHMRTVHGAQGI